MNRPLNFPAATEPTNDGKPATVIALHCSGSNGGQWRALSEALGSRYDLQTPNHFGAEAAVERCGGQPFTLSEEAARTLDLIDRSSGPVHLIGHSYGAAVALHAALSRPDRIASLTLYEPTAFHLLHQIGRAGKTGYAEITSMLSEFQAGLSAGDPCAAMSVFVDYWNGPGAWAALRPDHKAALCDWAPKVMLEFEAAMRDPTELTAYRSLRVPTLILRGEFAPISTRVIATALSETLPDGRLMELTGAGHMGPITHGAAVQVAILGHIAGSEASYRPQTDVSQRELNRADLRWNGPSGSFLAANFPVRGAA